MASNSLKLCEIQPGELEEVARFIQSQMLAPAPQVSAVVDRLRWILLENPARDPLAPLGWCLRSASGGVVGCMGCTPQEFSFGEKKFSVMVSTSFYVEPSNHGAGASIFLKFLQIARRYPLLVSSANPPVALMWQKLGGYAIGHSDHEVLGILRWKPVIAEAAYRKSGSALFGQAAGTLAAPWMDWLRRPRLQIEGCELSTIQSPEEAASLAQQRPRDCLTSLRDASYLKWRYFSAGDATARIFTFRHRLSEKPYLVAVNLRHRSYAAQIATLNVLDICGEPRPESYAGIAACLAEQYGDQIDMIVFRCLDQPSREALQAKGFLVRAFAAPIAWCIDKFGLLPSKNWYLVPADGDMML